jgi:hypothetical protein
LAVGHLPVDGGKQQEVGGWWAELFSLSDGDDKEKQDEKKISRATFGLTKIAGFQGGAATNSADKEALMSVLGRRTDLGRLQAAELAFSGASCRPHSQSIEDAPNNEKPEEESRNDVELLLCCLSDTGVVTTHVSGPLTFCSIVILCLTFFVFPHVFFR